jgi:peroxiredoxin Q/BCP
MALSVSAFAEPSSKEQTVSEIGLADGAVAPEIAAVTSDGTAARLASIAGENGTILVFVRSADWCPFCKKQLIELESAVTPLKAAGWSLAALSYDSAETLAAFKDENALSYALLSDEDSSVIRDFGLFNEESKEGSRFYGIPHPAIVFIGSDGLVKETLREEGYKDRPPADLILATAEGLN